MLRRQLFYDLTENGLINQRIVMALTQFAQQLDLTSEQKEHFLNRLLLQAKKLLAIWIHFDRFRREVDRLKPEAIIYDKDSPTEHTDIQYSQELYLEFDEFLVQYKSSLDYLAKVPAAFFGERKWNFGSFGDKGQRVIRMLRSVLPKEKKQLVADFEQKVFAAHRSDIEDAIEARDRINHYAQGGIPYENFRVFGIRESGEVTFREPMWSEEQTIRQFMEIAFHNHLKFCEDFIVFLLGFYLPPKFGFLHIPVPHNSTNSPWKLMPEALVPSFVEDLRGADANSSKRE